jgi:hypothetical protein
MKYLLAGTIALWAFASVNAARAADIPLKTPAAAVSDPGGFYVWLDGMYDNVRLPAYTLGFQNLTAGLVETGNFQTFDPDLNGGGIRGAVGYTLPGSSTRIEFGGSYISASGSLSQPTSPVTATDITNQLLNGKIAPGVGVTCNAGGFTCAIGGALSTRYDAWQLNGKIASDWKYGWITLTPSAAIFGGNSHAGQTLSQSFAQFAVGVVNDAGTYTANTSLGWTDIGGRAGLDVSAPLTNALTVGLRGWIGVAGRFTSLSGNDGASDTAGNFTGVSTISTSASKGVFLANAEAGMTYSITSMLTLRGFAGLNYDGSVPEITHPTLGGTAPAATSITPAGIGYAQETSYYAGGGLLAEF